MKYFTIEELTKSDTATRRGIDNTPTAEAVRNLTTLVDKVLDPLRSAWGGPIVVNSGYRCKALNEAVGGSKTS
ncbi:MAG: D-Ala-D-Ala carboxypeptidase family metallohydrolase, partial [Clostridiales bacterium]|nr:D-Ala-D-Ala carboxypeptidase family metallohydrolase [Clostridiales bacterium]